MLLSSHSAVEITSLCNHSHRIITLRVERSNLTHSQLYHFYVHTTRILIIFRFIVSMEIARQCYFACIFCLPRALFKLTAIKYLTVRLDGMYLKTFSSCSQSHVVSLPSADFLFVNPLRLIYLIVCHFESVSLHCSGRYAFLNRKMK